MDLIILNQSLESDGIVDIFTSLIWTDRYNTHGDFELYCPANPSIMAQMQSDFYAWNKLSDHLMIIESQEISSDTERGNFLTVTGRSLETILERRVVWNQTVLSGNFQDEIERLLNENAINPVIAERKIMRLEFEASTDPAIAELTIQGQYTGDNLYDVISKKCQLFGIGFKISLADTGKFVFKLYAGKDRSYDQVENPYVVFSPNFGNVIRSNSFTSKASLKTIALVAGEGEGSERVKATAEIPSGAGSDLVRREMYADARDLSRTVDGVEMPEAEYLTQLENRGLEGLVDNMAVQTFEGQVETSLIFVYGKDFFLGDVIQKADEYGHDSAVRVSEIIFVEDSTGFNVYPTFSNIE